MHGESHLSAAGLAGEGVGDGALVDATVVGRCGTHTEDVQHLIPHDLLQLIRIHGLEREREKRSQRFSKTAFLNVWLKVLQEP